MPLPQIEKIWVYGSLKKGFPRHYLIKDEVEFIGDMAMQGTLRNYKNLFPVWDITSYSHITIGELYLVTGDMDELLARLDKVEGHPLLFERVDLEQAMDVGDEDFDEEEEDDGNLEWHTFYAYAGRAPELLQGEIIQDGVWAIGKVDE
jgi:gamma-glutamylcyclotransferase (GGCT)/AIG2-like uncharacterized protein YtfP